MLLTCSELVLETKRIAHDCARVCKTVSVILKPFPSVLLLGWMGGAVGQTLAYWLNLLMYECNQIQGTVGDTIRQARVFKLLQIIISAGRRGQM